METTRVEERVPWWQVVTVGRNPRRTLFRIFILVVVCYLVRQFAFLPIRIEGISMYPAYRDRSVNVVNRLAYVFGEPKRGDVVAVRLSRGGESIMLLKRIVGLPGETVAFRNGRLLINGKVVDEPYVKLPWNWNAPPKLVESGEYYIVGDNRSMPQHDHKEGRTSRERIVGKAIL